MSDNLIQQLKDAARVSQEEERVILMAVDRIEALEARVKALELALEQTISYQKTVARKALEVREIGRRALESRV